MTAEANFFDDFISSISTSFDNAIEEGTNTVEDAVHNVENAAESLIDMSVEDEEVIFKYYNKEHPAGEPFDILEFNESKLKGWRKNAPLKVMTHGWISSDQAEAVCLIKDAYLEKYDFNLMTVDWSGPAKHNIYAIPASKTKGVGQIIARLLKELVKKRLVTWDMVHIIGHSLGAQVMGVAGAHTNGKVGRITGLDVAGPMFNEIDRPDIRVLDPTDAVFVEAIHTSGGDFGLGIDSSLGHADFYPNGGTHPQPGCSEINVICSHGRAYELYAESIMNPEAFVGKLCDGWAAFMDGKCDNNASAAMGDPTLNTATGNFYLATNDAPPYGNGK